MKTERKQNCVSFGTLLVGFLISTGCGTSGDDPRETETPKAVPQIPNVTPVPEQDKTAVADGPSTNSIDPADALSTQNKLKTLTSGEVAFLKPLSARSFSLKMTFKNGEKAVFKPMLRDDFRARYEVAAFRMAEHLGIVGLPVAAMRQLRLEFMALRLDKLNERLAEELRHRANPNGKGLVSGAMIAWVDDIDRKGFSKIGGKQSIMKWIASDGPSMAVQPLAAQASRMVSFDYVIGNWDRFSGGNLYVAKERRRLILLDHNGSFYRWADKRQQKMAALLSHLERFSKGFIDNIKYLDKNTINSALAGDPWHGTRQLLNNEEIALILSRRDALVTHVDTLISQKGEAAVLAFP